MWMNSSNNAMHGVQFMGIINALKTGNPTLDMLVAMIVPVLLSKIFQEMSRRDIWTLFGKKPAKKNPYQHSRSIVYRSTQAVSGAQINLDQDSQNLFLIQAVRLFAHKHCDIDLDNATMELTSMGRTSSAQQRAVNRACNTPQNSTAALLQSCKIVERPVERKWHHVGRFDGHSVRMWMSDSINANNKKSRSGGEDESSGSSNSVRCIEIRLEATGPSAINAFVQTAYDWFLKGIEQMEDTSRYYYDLRTFDGSSRPSYVRYTLGNDKTFESLFSHDISTTLLKIVDQFQEKTGKFAIKGFPHKIGILLHGPAGTGKTSLISEFLSRRLPSVDHILLHYSVSHFVFVLLCFSRGFVSLHESTHCQCSSRSHHVQ
jgi:chaperone BCS1